jgi:hypothetical protein
MSQLGEEHGLPPEAIAVTLVEPVQWLAADGSAKAGLRVWLLARAETHRFRVELATGAVERGTEHAGW